MKSITIFRPHLSDCMNSDSIFKLSSVKDILDSDTHVPNPNRKVLELLGEGIETMNCKATQIPLAKAKKIMVNFSGPPSSVTAWGSPDYGCLFCNLARY